MITEKCPLKVSKSDSLSRNASAFCSDVRKFEGVEFFTFVRTADYNYRLYFTTKVKNLNHLVNYF